MLCAPTEGKRSALRHHDMVREADAIDPTSMHPLLVVDREVTSFPSSNSLSKIFDKLCGSDHRNHSRRRPDQCFMSYARRSDPSNYGPSVTPGGDRVFCSSTLPGGAPVLDHLKGLLDHQDQVKSGGSFYPFVEDTVRMCSNHRQVTDRVRPIVQTLIFGVSSATEVANFLSAFNQEVEACLTPPKGQLPMQFYSLDVENVSGTATCPLKVVTPGGDVADCSSRSLPARVHLGFYDRRFDVVIPWVHTAINPDTYTGDHRLLLPDGPLPDYWHDLFAKLKGFGIGIGLVDDLKSLATFISSYYTFVTKRGPVKFRTVDLQVLLALAGYNTPKTCLAVLNFIFTGGVVQKQWRIRCGMGLWGTTAPLPPHLDLYLQSEAHAALNTAILCCLTILVHWFVTPGIAVVVSRKTPVKFLGWFERFLTSVLDGARLLGNPFQEAGDRARQPRALISDIQYSHGRTPPFDPGMLALCIPSWRNVTGGGCFSDQLAFDHLIGTVRLMVGSDGAPRHLRWESDLRVIDGFLTGRPSPSAATRVPSGRGCLPDAATRVIPEYLDSTTSLAAEPLRHLLRKYRAKLPIGHELKRATVNQLMLLHAWTYPEHILSLFELSSSNSIRSFFAEDYDLIRPLVLAFSARDDDYPVPDFYARFLRERRISTQVRQARTLVAADRLTEDPSRKRKHKEKFRQLRRKLFKAGVSIGRSSVSATFNVALDVPSAEVQTSDPVGESRTIRYAASPPPEEDSEEESDDEVLVIATADWDDL